jgi:hypothetical protein
VIGCESGLAVSSCSFFWVSGDGTRLYLAM